MILLLAAPAMALDTYMWGVGPRIGTHILPNRYPIGLPSVVNKYDFDKDKERDVDEDGDELFHGLEKVGFDFLFGAEAVYYAGDTSRIGLLLGGDLGKRYSDWGVLFKYDQVLVNESVDFLVGGGAGVSSIVLKGPDPERLRLPSFPLRVHASAQIRDDVRAYQFTLFGVYNLPSNSFYTKADGEEVDVGPGFYLTMGLEASVLFGDFTPPRPKKKR